MTLVVTITVVPSSGRFGWKLNKQGALVCYLKSAPENNKANYELCKAISKAVGCNSDAVYIITGLTQRKKTVHIGSSLSYEQFLDKIELDRQTIMKL